MPTDVCFCHSFRFTALGKHLQEAHSNSNYITYCIYIYIYFFILLFSITFQLFWFVWATRARVGAGCNVIACLSPRPIRRFVQDECGDTGLAQRGTALLLPKDMDQVLPPRGRNTAQVHHRSVRDLQRGGSWRSGRLFCKSFMVFHGEVCDHDHSNESSNDTSHLFAQSCHRAASAVRGERR